MALFSRGGKEGSGAGSAPEQQQVNPLVPKRAFCRVCDAERMFTRTWRRVRVMLQCPCCKLVFDNPAALYAKTLPLCPKCGEFLEQPNFDYGLCDGCGSKFELMDGTRPCLLPNYRQRQEMEKHGKSWSVL